MRDRVTGLDRQGPRMIDFDDRYQSPVFQAKTADTTRLTLAALFAVSALVGLFGCGRAAPISSGAASSAKDCDLERIWFHVVEDTSDMNRGNFSACEAACRDDNAAGCVGEGLLLY